MLLAIGTSKYEDQKEYSWFQSAQRDAENRNYFHWQLEFPKVFFGEQQGFDAVVGNPPYVRSVNLKKADKESWKYYKDTYFTASDKEFDIYLCFSEKGAETLNQTGKLGYILPNKWFNSQVGENMREYLLEKNYLDSIVDFAAFQVFEGVTTYTCLMFLSPDAGTKAKIRKLLNREDVESPTPGKEGEWAEGDVDLTEYDSDQWSFNIEPAGKLVDRLDDHPKLGEIANIFQGVGTRADDIFILEDKEDGLYSREEEEYIEVEDDILKPAVRGKDISNNLIDDEVSLIFPYERVDGNVELINPEELRSEHPKTWKYLSRHREQLEQREDGKYQDEEWYRYGRPQNMSRNDKENKIVNPDVSDHARAAIDDRGRYIVHTVYGVESDYPSTYLSALLNSKLLTMFLDQTSSKLRGGYFRMISTYLEPFPLPFIDEDLEKESIDSIDLSGDGTREKLKIIDDEVSEVRQKRRDLHQINLNIRDYLGNYSDGKTLGDISDPPSGVGDSILEDDASDRDSLRIGGVEFEEGNGRLVLKVSARYKPEDSENIDESELDRWGYFETEKVPAMKFNVEDKMRSLIEEFVFLAVDEAGGFAGFRESATKTNSVVDRLEKLTLPKLEDVEQGLEKFIDNREEAEELEEEIQETDELIDAIVFDLYDLTEEEVETVLDSLDTGEGEKERILGKFNSL